MSDAPARPAGLPRRILVLDDEPLVRRILSRMLASLDIVAVEAATIEHAERALASGGIDAVISDVMLEDGSGIDFAAALRSRGGPPVIIASGSMGALESASARIGGVRTLLKPVTRVELIASLRRTDG